METGFSMIEKIKTNTKKVVKNPAVRKSISSMKPNKNIWGFLGVIIFFILPEIIAYFWSENIVFYATEALKNQTSSFSSYYYEGLVLLFEDGMSWFNLAFGFALLIWLFF